MLASSASPPTTYLHSLPWPRRLAISARRTRLLALFAALTTIGTYALKPATLKPLRREPAFPRRLLK
eukprot:scaffold256052_cov33-Tisochrysis_lutea.AAC.1